MISFRCRINQQRLLPTIGIGLLIPMFVALSSICMGQGWRHTPVVSQILQDTIDDSAAPSIVITPDHSIYLVFSVSGGDSRYYTIRFADTKAFSHIPEGGKTYSRDKGSTNLMALDSSGTLHYVTPMIAQGDTVPCLGHWVNHTKSRILTPFSPPDTISTRTCNGLSAGGAIALDRSGSLHIVCTVADSILYFQRLPDSTWSKGVLLSDPTAISFAPSIAVSPSGNVNITFLSRASASDENVSILYTHSVQGLFQKPIPLAVRNGVGADEIAPIVVDSAGVGHVAFVDQSVGNVPSICYRDNLGGNWNPVEKVVADSGYAFGHLSLIGDRYGAMHMVGSYALDAPDSLSDRELLYATNSSGSWSAPVNITGNAAHDRAFNSGNGFLAVRDSLLAVAYTTTLPTGGISLTIGETLLDFNPYLDVAPDTIDMGTLYVGTFDATVTLKNRGERLYEQLRLARVEVLNGDNTMPSLIPPSMPEGIRGGDAYPLGLVFTGSNVGPFEMQVALHSNGGSDTVVVLGHLVRPPLARHVILLDTARTEVGSIASLTCRAIPAFDTTEGVDTLFFNLAFDPNALFPRRVLSINQNAWIDLLSDYNNKGMLSVRIAAPLGLRIAGSDLFTIEFEGLLTGNPENPVTFTVRSVPDSISATIHPGLVYLSGCEVAKNLRFGKAGFAGRITPNPVRDDLSFHYIAPSGVPVGVRFVDLLGNEHLESELPSGTGEVEEARIDMRSLLPGFYFIELHLGGKIINDMILKE